VANDNFKPWIENSNFTNFKSSFLKFTNFYTNFKTVRLKIHKIQIITFIAAKFQQIKLFGANTALNFWIKNSVISTISRIVDSSTVQHDD